jgi:hypothetical protein
MQSNLYIDGPWVNRHLLGAVALRDGRHGVEVTDCRPARARSGDLDVGVL